MRQRLESVPAELQTRRCLEQNPRRRNGLPPSGLIEDHPFLELAPTQRRPLRIFVRRRLAATTGLTIWNHGGQ
jgi:hypothetical protein